ncbi:MAG: GTPase ObgE [Bdellovibrionota bacterium]
MKFIDEATVEVKAGDGGNGCVAFRREKYVPKGGPSGGNGGHGGNVIFVGDGGLSTLVDLKFAPILRAEHGQHGMGSDMYGRRGESVVARVPIGTQVFDAATGEMIGDVTRAGQELTVAKGGRGGRGNMTFATSRNRAPRTAEPGEPGEEKKLRLELKLLADVGLVGLPNAGKSTLISRVSAAKPKVADYPFTTLSPVLGVVRMGEFKSFVLADLPGLIEGASEGAGMGTRFLKHVERCRVLVFLLDATPGTEPDAKEAFRVLEKELKAHNPDLLKRRRLVVLNKIDTGTPKKEITACRAFFRKKKLKTLAISGVTGEGVQELLYEIAGLLEESKAKEKSKTPATGAEEAST